MPTIYRHTVKFISLTVILSVNWVQYEYEAETEKDSSSCRYFSLNKIKTVIHISEKGNWKYADIFCLSFSANDFYGYILIELTCLADVWLVSYNII